MEDLLDTEIGKNDYDWLLTPPGTPRVPALDAAEKAPSSIVTKRTVTRSSSTTRASRVSSSEAENRHSTFPTRPARSTSVSRPTVQSNPISSNNRSSVLNANISSVSSRPTTPSKRTTDLTVSKQSVPSSRSVPTRSSTPVKNRPSTPVKNRPSTPVKNHSSEPSSMANSTAPKATSAQSSRSSTPTSRSRIISSSSSSTTSAVSRPSSSSSRVPSISRTTSSSSTVPSVSRSSSRSSTPTRQTTPRSSTPTRQTAPRSSTPSVGRSPSVGRISGSNNLVSNGRTLASSGRSAPSSAPSSRPSSPNTRARAPVRPLDIPDFPSETPPNLRTKLPERPLSAGRIRPGMASGVRSTANTEPVQSAPVKKMSVPAITRSKFSDIPSKTSSLTNGYQHKHSERSVLEGQPARTSRSVAATDNGFGRTISRKSLDMAIRHMDIRKNLGGIRGASLFPHSIRSTATKTRPGRASDPGHSISNGDRYCTDNGSSNGNFSGDSSAALSHNGGSSIGSPDRENIVTKEVLSELDIYANSRYEAMLLKEDTKNTNWLHSADDKSDQSPVFDHRFEPLPEPFIPL